MAEAPDLAPLIRLADEACHAGRTREAADAMRALHLLAPDNLAVRAALARTLFRAEMWDEAWDAYDVRFALMPAAFPRVRRNGAKGPEPVPIWRGGPVPPAILVMGEQGLGDTIQFARYLPMLRATGTRAHVVLDARLHALLAPLCAGLDLRPPGDGTLRGVRHWVPLLGLPRALGLKPEQYRGPVPYLRTDPERTVRWRSRIGGGGLNIGIVWQGNPKAPVDAVRSAPLAAFAPLAEIPGVHLFALQKGPGEEQAAPFPLERLGPEMDGGSDWFLDTAAALSALDLLVTVDTAVLHLAGALGRPALMLAHGRETDWRWSVRRTDTIWYPSLRLVHCPDGGADWGAAAASAAAMIRAGDLPAPASGVAPLPGQDGTA